MLEELLFNGILVGAGNGFPAENGDSRAYERANYHNPEIAPCVRGEHSRAKRTSRVYRAIIHRYANDIYKAEGNTDCETGKFAGAFLCVGGGKNHEYEEECEQAFGEKSHAGCGRWQR